jgi:hypothetical protein
MTLCCVLVTIYERSGSIDYTHYNCDTREKEESEKEGREGGREGNRPQKKYHKDLKKVYLTIQ